MTENDLTVAGPETQHKAGIGDVVRVACGNFLEMFDFMVFSYFAVETGNAFFPNRNLTGTC